MHSIRSAIALCIAVQRGGGASFPRRDGGGGGGGGGGERDASAVATSLAVVAEYDKDLDINVDEGGKNCADNVA